MSELRIIATVMVYNEADIIAQLLKHLDDQGIYFVVLDGGSSDASIEIVQEYRGKRLLEHAIVRRDSISLKKDLDYSLEMVRRYDPDWILRNDSDEFLEAPDVGETLAEGIAKEDRRGYNLIQFNNFEFCLTERELVSRESNVQKKLRFYTYSDDFRYKAWKYYPKATDSETCGHYPVFPPGIRVSLSPRKFIMKHYRFRSAQQAMRRVFRDRLPRYSYEERTSKLWHVQYDGFKTTRRSFVRNSKALAHYDNQSKWDLTLRYTWYPGEHFHTQQEILLLSKIQERTGLLALSLTWKLLHQVKVLKNQIFPTNTRRNTMLQKTLQITNQALS